MAEVLQQASHPAGKYFHGCSSSTSETLRTIGKKFKNCDSNLDVGYGRQFSKRQKTGSSSDFSLLDTLGFDATRLLSQFIKDSQQIEETISVQSEEVDLDATDDCHDLNQSERAQRIEEQEDLFQAKKLSLVLDLDHTLLHTVRFDEIDAQQQEMLKAKEERDKQKPQRHLFCLPHLKFWTKLRPGIWNFLEQASKVYELHICTMGGEIYAMEMAELLDPTGKYFDGRVVSKLGKGIKDLDEVLGTESTAIIVDDTVNVWPNHMTNLIHVEKYMYFPSQKRQPDLPLSSLFERRRDERADGGVLASAMTLIQKVHQNFYSNPWISLGEVDVRCILEQEKRNVLAGCYILFSGVFPVDGATPEKELIWKDARQFGAVCSTEMDSQVTHVVSEKSGTLEVNWARATGRFVVSPRWIGASMFFYHKANENDFAVE
ncbi:protein-serine/threonine phosphatase [Ranunculus cassubicifolius]